MIQNFERVVDEGTSNERNLIFWDIEEREYNSNCEFVSQLCTLFWYQ